VEAPHERGDDAVTHHRPTPPKLPERLLAAVLGSARRDGVIGDLHEEFVAHATRSGRLGLHAWYWCHALRLAARFALHRLPWPARSAHTVGAIPTDFRQETLMLTLAADLKYAVRAIRKQPGVSVVVALTLALGLGINATVLGMMDALLLRPFQFRDYPRLVVLWEAPRGGEREMVAPANFLDWRKQSQSVEQLAAWGWLDATLTGRGEPERVQGFRVSAGFFELLSITPALGRTFTADEDRLGNHRRVILGDGIWKRRFGADAALVGTDVLVDGESHTVVGIAPPGFAFPVGSELWVPLAFTPAQAADRETRSLTVAGKLANGRTTEAAQAEMDVIGRALSREHPSASGERGVSVRSLSTAFREGSTVPFVGILQAAAGLVLIVACANVAGLLLARAIDRQRELALRTALGASRLRIVRQLVTETVVLGLFASILAILIAKLGLDALRSSIPAESARFVEGWDNLRLDGRLLVAIPALAIGVGLLIGLLPAVAASRAELTDVLREGDRGATGGIRRQRGRQALVVGEIALALALLIAAGLTLAGGVRLSNDPGGFDTNGLMTLQVPLPDSKYGEAAARREFAAALLARFEATPGVQHAALANILPASGWSPVKAFVAEHDPIPEGGRRPQTGYRAVSTHFFDALRVPILRGRTFSAIDREGSQPVAIVSESLAERFWPGQDPVGRRLRLDGSSGEWLHIVGVSGNVRMYNWWDGEDSLAVYVPLRQAPPGGLLYAVIRAHGDPAALSGAGREVVKAVDPSIPVSDVRTMREAIVESSAGLTNLAVMMGICGAIGLVLSIVGIYSVMSYAVSQRMHEFGVRMALGATARDLFRITLTEAGTLTAIGVFLGLLLAVVLGRLLGSALFGLISLHAATFAVVGLGLALISLGASYLPARRALKCDPATILRGQ
jgi:putative ABC transport system permease protein